VASRLPPWVSGTVRCRLSPQPDRQPNPARETEKDAWSKAEELRLFRPGSWHPTVGWLRCFASQDSQVGAVKTSIRDRLPITAGSFVHGVIEAPAARQPPWLLTG